jgi:hypothetical protein
MLATPSEEEGDKSSAKPGFNKWKVKSHENQNLKTEILIFRWSFEA